MMDHTEFTAEESQIINKRLRSLFIQEFSIKIDNVYIPLSEKEKQRLEEKINSKRLYEDAFKKDGYYKNY